MTVHNDISQYIAYFRGQNEKIAKVDLHIFKKIIYLVEIDTLSRAAFPAVSGNRRRVVQFIDTFSSWGDRDRISAVQLKFTLEENGIHSGQLYGSINSCIDSWPYGRIIRPDNDPTLGELQHLATPNEVKYVNEARYAELLYTYRNHLLHEFREPGKGIERGADPTTPFYIGMDNLDTGESSWELVFPVHFLQNLCESCINGLEDYLIANNLNPYDAYKFGTMWRRS
jgi:hypothetical protein